MSRGKVIALTVAALLVIIAIPISVWAFTVGTSDIKGRGDAVKLKNSAVNRIGAQEEFEQLNADFTGYLVKIRTAKEAVAGAASADKPFRQVELIGVRQLCTDTAQQYNANSRKYTQRDFKAVDLPFTLDPGECTR